MGVYSDVIPALSENSLSGSDVNWIEKPAETVVTSDGIVLQSVNAVKNASGIFSAVIGLSNRLFRRGSSPVYPVSGEHDSVSNTDVDGAAYTP